MTKYALISVFDKTGIEVLAQELVKLGYTILSTSNTAKYLQPYCPDLVQVSDITGFPEIMDGRVKTLHPVIHGGILADRNNPEHMATLAVHKIDRIDVVAVNLYPFAKVRATQNAGYGEIIENIDIGGPTLIRAAAKNSRHVMVLVDPDDYQPSLDLLRQNTTLPDKHQAYLAAKAFQHISSYDEQIAEYFSGLWGDTAAQNIIPEQLKLACRLQSPLRYGENPHQQAGLYYAKEPHWKVIHGMQISFNNLLDLDAALRAIRLYEEPTVIIIKHTNPCGIASGESLAEAYQKAFAVDTVSPYGGIVVVNRKLDLEAAMQINHIFTELVIAPDFETAALELLYKKKNRRLIRYDQSVNMQMHPPLELKTIQGAYLAQEWDSMNDDKSTWKVVTNREPEDKELKAMEFGYKAVSILKSNAIVLAAEDRILGLGSGQTSRVDSCFIATWRAKKYGHNLQGAILASDGFIPFRDTIDEAAANGISAIIQPGGSKGDEECIAACNELNIAMVFTGNRHFRH